MVVVVVVRLESQSRVNFWVCVCVCYHETYSGGLALPQVKKKAEGGGDDDVDELVFPLPGASKGCSPSSGKFVCQGVAKRQAYFGNSWIVDLRKTVKEMIVFVVITVLPYYYLITCCCQDRRLREVVASPNRE